MYQQIVDYVKLKVGAGDWRPGDEIPSIRGFAADSGVSVITVRRAYYELEREGVVVSRKGRGSFIADHAVGLDLRLREEEVGQQLDEAVESARTLGWTDRRIREALEDSLQPKSDRGSKRRSHA